MYCNIAISCIWTIHGFLDLFVDPYTRVYTRYTCTRSSVCCCLSIGSRHPDVFEQRRICVHSRTTGIQEHCVLYRSTRALEHQQYSLIQSPRVQNQTSVTSFGSCGRNDPPRKKKRGTASTLLAVSLPPSPWLRFFLYCTIWPY